MAEIHGETAPRMMDYSYKSEIHDFIQILNISGNSSNADDDHQAYGLQIIFADNQGAIKWSKNPQHYNWTKHINVKYHFV